MDRVPAKSSVLDVALLLIAVGLGLHSPAFAQQAARKAATVSALVTYPVFFHGQQVVVRGEVQAIDGAMWLLAGKDKVRLFGSQAGPGGDGSANVEVRGILWDVGRLESTDPRVRAFDLETLSRSLFGKDWPGIGELIILSSDSLEPAEPPAAPGVRTIALDPERYLDQRVTVTGRFRGRNLYGDLPRAPGKSQWDFVLHSADAAIWVTGLRPRGRDFNLNVEARVDTGQWLEVVGTVKEGGGLVWIEAAEIRRATAPQETQAAGTAILKPPPGPPPEVIFSTPLPDETDVARAVSVRIQFSRDMIPASFKDQVKVGYVGPVSADQLPLIFKTDYQEGNRVLEIRFTSSIEPFRTLKVELLAGIESTDHQPLTPWSMTFSVGS